MPLTLSFILRSVAIGNRLIDPSSAIGRVEKHQAKFHFLTKSLQNCYIMTTGKISLGAKEVCRLADEKRCKGKNDESHPQRARS